MYHTNNSIIVVSVVIIGTLFYKVSRQIFYLQYELIKKELEVTKIKDKLSLSEKGHETLKTRYDTLEEKYKVLEDEMIEMRQKYEGVLMI